MVATPTATINSDITNSNSNNNNNSNNSVGSVSNGGGGSSFTGQPLSVAVSAGRGFLVGNSSLYSNKRTDVSDNRYHRSSSK